MKETNKEFIDRLLRQEYRQLAKRVNQRLVRAERASASDRKKMTGYKQAMRELHEIGRNRFNESKNVTHKEIARNINLLRKLGANEKSMLTKRDIKRADKLRLEGFQDALSPKDAEGNIIKKYQFKGIENMDEVYDFLESDDFKALMDEFHYETAIEMLDEVLKEQPDQEKLMDAFASWRKHSEIQGEKATKDFILNFVQGSENK